jgi:hypothetical protein
MSGEYKHGSSDTDRVTTADECAEDGTEAGDFDATNYDHGAQLKEIDDTIAADGNARTKGHAEPNVCEPRSQIDDVIAADDIVDGDGDGIPLSVAEVADPKDCEIRSLVILSCTAKYPFGAPLASVDPINALQLSVDWESNSKRRLECERKVPSPTTLLGTTHSSAHSANSASLLAEGIIMRATNAMSAGQEFNLLHYGAAKMSAGSRAKVTGVGTPLLHTADALDQREYLLPLAVEDYAFHLRRLLDVQDARLLSAAGLVYVPPPSDNVALARSYDKSDDPKYYTSRSLNGAFAECPSSATPPGVYNRPSGEKEQRCFSLLAASRRGAEAPPRGRRSEAWLRRCEALADRFNRRQRRKAVGSAYPLCLTKIDPALTSRDEAAPARLRRHRARPARATLLARAFLRWRALAAAPRAARFGAARGRHGRPSHDAMCRADGPAARETFAVRRRRARRAAAAACGAAASAVPPPPAPSPPRLAARAAAAIWLERGGGLCDCFIAIIIIIILIIIMIIPIYSFFSYSWTAVI